MNEERFKEATAIYAALLECALAYVPEEKREDARAAIHEALERVIRIHAETLTTSFNKALQLADYPFKVPPGKA